MRELYNELQKLVGYEIETVLVSDDDIQIKFSNGYGVSIDLIFDKDGITITPPYAQCHKCCELPVAPCHKYCESHGCEHDQDNDGVKWDEDADEFYDIGYDDGYNEGYNDGLRSFRKGDK